MQGKFGVSLRHFKNPWPRRVLHGALWVVDPARRGRVAGCRAVGGRRAPGRRGARAGGTHNARAGKPVARLVPVEPRRAPRQPGSAKGQIWIARYPVEVVW